MNYGKKYRNCIKRNGEKTWMQSTCYIVTSCHRNDDKMWSTSCLIMQHKPYIVELSFTETQKSNDSINEGPSIATDGPSQTNAVHVACMMSHVETIGRNLSLISNHIPCHLSTHTPTLKSIPAHLTTLDLFPMDAVTSTYMYYTYHYTYTVK